MNKTHDAYLIRVSSYDWALIEHYIAKWIHEADPGDEIEIAVFEQWVSSFEWDSEDADPDNFEEHKEKPDWVTRDDELWPETWDQYWADNEEVQS